MGLEGTKKNIAIFSVITISAISIFLISKKLFLNNSLKLKRIASKDINRWKGKVETDPLVSSELVDYWKNVGLTFTESDMQKAGTHSNYPWSAVYVSHLINKAGYKNFDYSRTHSSYTVNAKKDRDKKLEKSFWAYKPSEKQSVETGDILIKNRGGNNYNLDNINSGLISHGDVVVDIEIIGGKKYAYLQGGNISDTIKKYKILLTDDNKLINNTTYFAQLKYKK